MVNVSKDFTITEKHEDTEEWPENDTEQEENEGDEIKEENTDDNGQDEDEEDSIVLILSRNDDNEPTSSVTWPNDDAMEGGTGFGRRFRLQDDSSDCEVPPYAIVDKMDQMELNTEILLDKIKHSFLQIKASRHAPPVPNSDVVNQTSQNHARPNTNQTGYKADWRQSRIPIIYETYCIVLEKVMQLKNYIDIRTDFELKREEDGDIECWNNRIEFADNLLQDAYHSIVTLPGSSPQVTTWKDVSVSAGKLDIEETAISASTTQVDRSIPVTSPDYPPTSQAYVPVPYNNKSLLSDYYNDGRNNVTTTSNSSDIRARCASPSRGYFTTSTGHLHTSSTSSPISPRYCPISPQYCPLSPTYTPTSHRSPRLDYSSPRLNYRPASPDNHHDTNYYPFTGTPDYRPVSMNYCPRSPLYFRASPNISFSSPPCVHSTLASPPARPSNSSPRSTP